jgi:predicted MFS family arabinose efflux permease
MGATAQGLLSSTQMGLGGAVGGILGGFLYEAQGSAAMFAWVGIIQAFGTSLFIVANKLKRPGEA